eukprot:TRINITY_DN12203_c0_g1_i1.p1 TRINITY_DN12203_c0_g1~~TRINITY_DN12203_c0_g1_i1.p1  ORF type:complete len:425 (-),score=52.82 TRINITY_DN12203_c0_g1_i1:230-1504(-)
MLGFVREFFRSKANEIRQKVESKAADAAPHIYEWSLKAAILIVTLWILALLSAASYFLFYMYWVVPPSSLIFSSPLHFSHADSAALELQQTLVSSKHYAATVAPLGALTDPSKVDHYRDLSAVLYPVARTCIGPLTTGTKYDYTIDVTLPETPANLAAGNFMVRLFLYSDGTAAPENPHFPQSGSKSTRATMAHRSISMRYRSGLRRSLYAFVFAIPIALGISWFDEYQTISTTLIHDLAHTGDSGEICLAVSVNNPRIQIYEGSINIIAKLEGLRYWCYHWFLTCFLIGSSIFFSIYGFIALCLFGIIYTKMQHEKAREEVRRELAEAQRSVSKSNGAPSPKESDKTSSSNGEDYENEPVRIQTPLNGSKSETAPNPGGAEQRGEDVSDPYDSDSAAGTGLRSLGPAVGLNSSEHSGGEDDPD